MLLLWLGEAETFTTMELRLQNINTDMFNNINNHLRRLLTNVHFLFVLFTVPIHASPPPPPDDITTLSYWRGLRGQRILRAMPAVA